MPTLPDFFLANPVARDFKISHPFNEPRDYSFAPHRKQLHEGVDLVSVEMGRPVAALAAQRGVVAEVGFSAQGYGNYVRIVHKWGEDEWVTWYGHLSSVDVRVGQFVQPGQKLGISGTTGNSTGVHLHLTLQHIGHGLSNYVVADVVDPTPFFKVGETILFDDAVFVADVTIPDGTKMQPGESFEKSWRIRNTGTSTWDADYKLVCPSGENMGGPEKADLSRVPVKPGEVAQVAVRLTAPTDSGTHRTTWQMRAPNGTIFGHDLYAEIVVKTTTTGDGFDQASFVADITVPDGTVIDPGEQFVKTWRIRNSGNTTWTEQYTLRFISDNRMGGPASVPLGKTVRPGEVTEVSVKLTAPEAQGRHRSTWKLHNIQGEFFPFDLYTEIQVPRKTVTTSDKLSEIRWLADKTIPDGTVIKAGETFEKIWRVRNSGETTWGPGFELAFFGDDQMGAPDNIPLPAAAPGDVVEVSITFTAPDTPGEQRSTWKGRDPQGKLFEFDLFVLIEVEDAQQPPRLLDEMNWVADVSVPDGMEVKPGESFVKTWRVRNTGETTWGPGYTFAFFADDKMNGPDSVALPATQPGETADISVNLTAPTAPGMRKSTWKGRNPQGKFFDYHMFALVDVVDPNQTYDMLQFMRGDGRVYDLRFTWAGGGSQRIQTQTEGDRFYHVKFREWEELWADNRFIYRGTDTSPGGGEVYTLTENGQYGSPWLPRRMSVGVPFLRTPKVIFRNKSNGKPIADKQFTHVTWIKLVAVHSSLRFDSGIELHDVAELAAYEEVGGKPKNQPFEHYYYAKKYGLVAWRGSLGKSFIAEDFASGTMPDNQREALDWPWQILGT